LPKFTGASTISNSQVFDNGTTVGIGIIVPNSNPKLHVFKGGGNFDTIVADGDAGTNTGFGIYEAGIQKYALYNNGSSGNDSFNIYNTATGSNSLTIYTSGNVGINSASDAGFKLDVNGTGRYNQNNTSVGNATGIRLEQAGSGDVAISYLLTGVREWLMGVDNSDSDSFKINNITGSGDFSNVGLSIATTGAATFSSSVTALRYIANAQATYASLTYEETFKYASSPAGIWFGNSFNSNNNVALQLRTSNDGTSVQALTITSGGNVLIGTTTNGASKLRIVGLPTSAAGLSSGDVWSDSGTLKIA
jgi:hypothetical protein